MASRWFVIGGVCDLFDSAYSDITYVSVWYRGGITLKSDVKKYVKQIPWESVVTIFVRFSWGTYQLSLTESLYNTSEWL